MRYLCLLALGGCALSNHTITSEYVPSGGGGWSAQPVEVVAVEVQPTLEDDAEAVGVKKNGYGIDTATIFVEPSPTAWLRQALEAELGAHGLTGTGDNPWISKEKAGKSPRLEVNVEQLFIEPDVGFWRGELTAVAIARVRVTLPDGRRFRRRFVAEVNEKMMAWLDKDYERLLHEVTETLLSAIGREVRALLDREKPRAM